MRSKTWNIIGCILVSFLSDAYCMDLYLDVKSGVCNVSTTGGYSFRSNVFTSVGIGRKVFDKFRLETQVNHVQFDAKNPNGDIYYLADEKKARTYVTSLFASVCRDFEVSELLSVYIGTGIGCSRLRVFTKSKGNDVTSDAKYLLTWQVMLGIAYKFSEKWSILGGYRCMKMANTNIEDKNLLGGPTSYRTPLLHCFEIGLRYAF